MLLKRHQELSLKSKEFCEHAVALQYLEYSSIPPSITSFMPQTLDR